MHILNLTFFAQAIIPRSSSKEHIFSNLRILDDQALSREEMKALNALDSAFVEKSMQQ